MLPRSRLRREVSGLALRPLRGRCTALRECARLPARSRGQRTHRPSLGPGQKFSPPRGIRWPCRRCLNRSARLNRAGREIRALSPTPAPWFLAAPTSSLRAPLCPPGCLFPPQQRRTCLALSCLDLLAAGIRHLGHGRSSSSIVCARQCTAAAAAASPSLHQPLVKQLPELEVPNPRWCAPRPMGGAEEGDRPPRHPAIERRELSGTATRRRPALQRSGWLGRA